MPESHRPTMLAVDDDPHVLRAIRRDLSRVYQDKYRVLASTSAAEGLRILDKLRDRGEEPALLLVDQRMPEMTGIQFLDKSLDRFPLARRVLLTAYADTAVAIDAINRVRLHHYLVKPWEPPEERLYPVVDDLLSDWQASYQPPYGGIRIAGHRFAPATHRVRDFLTRLQQPFRFMDVDRVDLPELDDVDPAELPVVLMPDGTVLTQPNYEELVEALGLTASTSRPHYDVAIVGGGPTGLATAVYSSSEGLSTLLLDAYVPGGQAGTSSRIENYLGFPAGVSGAELTRRAVAQARRFGTDILSPVAAVSLRRAGRARMLALSDGREVSAGCVLLSTGLSYRRLNAHGAEQFEGAGIYYGATAAETTSCVDQHVWIVGGANSAGQAAMHFAQHASRVTMLVRADSLQRSMSQYLIDEIEQHPNIRVRLNTRLVAAEGKDRLECVTLHNVLTDQFTTEPAEFLFTFIGATPRTQWLDGTVMRDSNGFLLTGADTYPGNILPAGWDLQRYPLPLETSVPGVFAAGDARANSVKRIASGVGEGAMAAALIHQYRAES
nr:FAD-dependent oxidoreductase [Kibdelosporangium sp. MJ126-NF4]CEL18432.1 Thioredoxin reductase [Kibdelosporangium sp. MJ126-NF4]